MEQPVLTDKDQFPTDEVIFSHIGKSRALWTQLFDQIHREHPDFAEHWKYYLDGKSWLLKVTRKEKTIFWLAVADGSFRTAFYFTDKAKDAIAKSSLSESLKKQYKEGSKNKLRGVRVVYKSKRDIEDAMQLIEIKTGIK